MSEGSRTIVARAVRTTALLGLSMLGGCTLWPASEGYPYTTTDPMSDFGMHTHELYVTVTYIVCTIFVLVSALLAYTLFRFRDDGRPGNPEQIHGNLQMEIGWTLLPIGIVLTMIIPTIRTIFVIGDAAPIGAVGDDGKLLLAADGSPAKPTVEIKVTGKRWWWAFDYVGTGITTANQLAIPDDRPVSLLITSDTVIHSFWVPRIGGKRDAVPGRVNRIWFNLNKDQDVKPGEISHIRGECAEYCGEAHALMRFEVLALDGGDFDAWLKEMAEPRPIDASVKAAGEAAFAAGGCAACHQITGNPTASTGLIGPNLTAFGDRRWLAAGVHDLFPGGRADDAHAKAMLKQWITDPNSLKPGTTKSANKSRALDGMNIPADKNGDGVLQNEELSSEQVDALVAYLLAMKTSYPLQ